MKSEVLNKLARDTVLIHTTVEIPAKSFAVLDSYDDTNHYFIVTKPNADNMSSSKVVVVPELIAANKAGIAYIGGIHVVLMTGGESIAAGDMVGTDENEWTAIEGVGFYVVDVFTNDIVIRLTPYPLVVGDGLWFDDGVLKVKIDSDQFQFDTGALQTKIDECP